jgi:Coiled-coil domain of unknown function
MLKQAIPPILGGSHGTRSDGGEGPSFPPFNNLPQWTRVNTLARTCPPKPLLKDRLNRLPESSSESSKASSETVDELYSPYYRKFGPVASADSANSDRRVRQLEHSIVYLKQQHDDLLGALHQEIDKLKRENRGMFCYFH